MKYIFLLLLCTGLVFVNCKKDGCKQCLKNLEKEEVCGSDGKIYKSYCILTQQACLTKKDIQFECDGKCPCDPDELKSMDKKTVSILSKYRKEQQLQEHIKRDLYEQENFPYDVSENAVDTEVVLKCTKSQLIQLPARLIDWFHVLKTNEKERLLKQKGIKRANVLVELKYMQSKLNTMYSALACKSGQSDDVEREVCLPPVQWMFRHLDTNFNHALSQSELESIEQMHDEGCIRPFLENCDYNDDRDVTLKEFCKCLCYTPPCTHVMESVPTVLVKGEPQPSPGHFAPTCDEDGFFFPKQCNSVTNECWCVNRHGAEFQGTRRNMTVNLSCGDNTNGVENSNNLIPLDVEKENRL